MGTDVYRTGDSLLEIIKGQFCPKSSSIEAVTLTGGFAHAAAVKFDLAKVRETCAPYADAMETIYEIGDDGFVTVGFIALISGGGDTGGRVRQVSVKMMPEYTGPYYFVAGPEVLNVLSPLRDDRGGWDFVHWPKDWRAACADKIKVGAA